MTDFFKIERIKEDIPFYNGIPELSASGWILWFVCFVIFILINRIDLPVHPYVGGIIPAVVIAIPIFYVLRGNYSLLFKRITKKDVPLIIVFTFIGFVYSFAALAVLGITGIIPMAKIGFNFEGFISTAGWLAIPLFGEELFKISALIFSMFVLYRFSHNRKAVLVISIIITCILFGVMHERQHGLLRALLIQGVACVFDMLLYLNSKNILVTYISHLLFDFITISTSFLEFS